MRLMLVRPISVFVHTHSCSREFYASGPRYEDAHRLKWLPVSRTDEASWKCLKVQFLFAPHGEKLHTTHFSILSAVN